MSFYKEVPGRKTTLESTLKFDTAPTEGSTNPVTSDGVKGAIDGAVGDASAALQNQIDDIAEKAGSGYTPKGEASVATLNALSGQENGELYTMTDAGTLTLGSLAVVAGDTVAWDATNEVWYKAMDYVPRQYGTNEVHNLPTTVTSFRTGDVIPVDGPEGPAKMVADCVAEASSVGQIVLDRILFEQGNFDIGGNEIDSSTRIRTTDYIAGTLEFTCPEGFLVGSIFYFDAVTKAFNEYVSSGKSHVKIFKSGCVSRFTIRNVDGSEDISVDDIYSFNDRFLTIEDKAELEASIEEIDSRIGTIDAGDAKNVLEFGKLTLSGSNNLYVNNDILEYKRSGKFFKLKKGATIPFDCLLYGYDESFSFVSLIMYNAGDEIPSNYVWMKVVVEKYLVDNDDAVTWEQGRLSAGLPVDANNYVRTDFLSFETYKNYLIKSFKTGVNVAVYCYDSTNTFINGRVYGYIGFDKYMTRSISSIVENQSDVSYIKVVFHTLPETVPLLPSVATDYVAIGEVVENSDFDSVNVFSVLENAFNTDNSNATIKFSYPLYYSKGRDLTDPTMDSKQYDSTIYHNSGLLRLPYNYTQSGHKCPIVIFVHPSDAMGSFNDSNDFIALYEPFWQYLQKEGFAILDCYHMSSKYASFDWTCDWGLPIANACYEQALKWVVDNYNVDYDKVFVSCKSQGGIRAMLMAMGNSSIPVKAVGGLAPLLGICPQYGYSEYDIRMIIDDAEFEGVHPDVTSISQSKLYYPGTTQEWKDYMDANNGKIVGLNTYMTNCISGKAIDLFDRLKNGQYTSDDFVNARRFTNVPVKIWHARDDVNVPCDASIAFVKQLQNSGCNAEIRIMPNGTGGHGAVSFNELSIRVPSLTTRLGYTCTDIPLAMVELVNWFMKYGG